MDNYQKYELKKHIQLGKFVILILIMISTYNFIIELVDNNYIDNDFTSYITTSLLILASIPIFLYLKKTKLPITLFGFNLNNLRKNIIESIFWSIAFCVLVTLIKFIVIQKTNLLNTTSTIEINIFFKKTGGYTLGIIYMLIYTICAILQTIGCNGFVQSSIKNLSKSRYAVSASIVSSTLLFSSFHIDLHFIFALLVIPVLAFWGIMYDKQESLVGVSISHIIIGIWVLFFLNFSDILYSINQIIHH